MHGPWLASLLVVAASAAGSALAVPLTLPGDLNQHTLEVPNHPTQRRWLAPRDIQGASWLSKYDKQRVDIEGIVTARS